MAQRALGSRAAVVELALAARLSIAAISSAGGYLSMTIQTSAGHVAAGGDALVHEGGEHPRAVGRHALGDAVERR